MNIQRLAFLRSPLGLFVPLSVGVLLVCLYYTYVAVFRAPYPGITLAPNWIVEAIPPCEVQAESCQADENALQPGDQLVQVDHLTYAQSRQDRRHGAFEGYQPGDVVSIVVRRDDRELTVEWRMRGPTQAEILQRLSSLFIYLPFWIAGTAVMLSLRPRDQRSRLFILFNLITALWLAIGLFSSFHTAGASLVLHALSWLMVPIYLHFHLTIPSPLLPRYQRYLVLPLYLAAAVLAVLELDQRLPDQLYGLGLLVAIGGSLMLLGYRMLRAGSAADRLASRLIFAGIAVSFMPGIVLAILPRLLRVSLYETWAPEISVLAVLFLPYVYIYAIYKHHLGSLEFRANRLLGVCVFIIIYATAFIVIQSISSHWLGFPAASLEFNLILSAAFVILAIPLRDQFQQLVDRLAYGVEFAPERLLHEFSNRIASALDPEALVQLLARDVAPSLLIRQSALFTSGDDGLWPIYSDAPDVRTGPQGLQAIRRLAREAGQYRPPETSASDEFSWVRLAIALRVREELCGIWLLGRRDPDDFYPARDVTLLNTLGAQIATALENIRLFAETRRAAQQLEIMRQKLQEALQEAVLEKSRYAAVIHSMGAAAVITDQNHRIAAVNTMAETMLRQSQSSLLDRPWPEIFSLGEPGTQAMPSFWDPTPVHSNGENGLSVRGRFPLRTNPDVVLDIVSTQVQADGHLAGYVHILRDVSAMEEFTRTKNEFLLNVAHELAGPLASWRASIDLLIEDYATVNARDLGVMLRTLQRTAVKLQNLIETLIDIGRMQAGRFVVRPVMLRFNQLILDGIAQSEPLLKAKGQQLDLHLDCPPGCTVVADRQRIIQVIVNFLRNASKYAPEDRPIELSAHHDGGRVYVEVSDHGPGIPPEEQPQLFKRFYRAKQVDDEGAGLGIGLALVKGIVEAHGGQVGVRSRMGEGSTFWFSLPEVERYES